MPIKTFINPSQIRKIRSKRLDIKGPLSEHPSESPQIDKSRLNLRHIEGSIQQIVNEFHNKFNIDCATLEQSSNPKSRVTLEYVQSLELHHFISLVTYLCYYNNGITPPELLNLLYLEPAKSEYKCTITEETNKLKLIIELCQLIRSKLCPIKIDKINTLFKKEANIHDIFLKVLAHTEENAISTLKVLHFAPLTDTTLAPQPLLPGELADAEEIYPSKAEAINQAKRSADTHNPSSALRLSNIKTELNEIAKKIHFHNKSIKGGGILNPKYSLIGNANIAATGTFNTLAGFSALSTRIAQAACGGDNDTAAELNTLAQICAGLIWAMNRKSGINLALAERQAIGLYKRQLLKLIKLYYTSGGSLNKAELKFFNKFFATRRGNLLSNFLQYFFKTNSLKQFNQIIQPQLNKFDLDAKSHLILNNIQPGDFEDPVPDFFSFVEQKYTFKDLIAKKDFSGLEKFLTQLTENFNSKNSDFQETNNLLLITFKLNRFRGNLLAHLLSAYTANPANREIKNCLTIVWNITQKLSPEVKLLKSKSYSEILIWLNSYEVSNKHSFLIDWQHILLAIIYHPKLKEQERISLFDWLDSELKNTSDGKFEVIRAKRDPFIKEMVLGSLFYQGRNLKRDAKAVDNLLPLTSLNPMINIAAGAIGYATYALLSPLCEHCSRGNTTTYSSAKKILNNSYALITQQKLHASSNTEQSNSTKAEVPPDPLEQIKKRFEALALCSNDSLEDLKLEVLDLNLAYLALASTHKGEMLLFSLFCSIIENSTKQIDALTNSVEFKQLADSPSDQEKQLNRIKKRARKSISILEQVWANAVKQVIELEQSYGKHVKYKPITQWDINEFSKFCSNGDSSNAKDGLVHFFRIVGLIIKEDDLDLKTKKLEYLSGIIDRLKVDNTSNWNVLKKRNRSQELLIRALIRASGAIIWGSVGGILSIKSFGLTAVPLLIGAGISRGVLYGASTGFKYSDTKDEYIKARNEILFLNQRLNQPKNEIKSHDVKLTQQQPKPIKPQKLYAGINNINNLFNHSSPSKSGLATPSSLNETCRRTKQYEDPIIPIELINQDRLLLAKQENKQLKALADIVLDSSNPLINSNAYDVVKLQMHYYHNEEINLLPTASPLDHMLYQDAIANDGLYSKVDTATIKKFNEYFYFHMPNYHNYSASDPNPQAINEIQGLLKIVEEVINDVSITIDKYLASQSLFRIIAIIKLTNLPHKLKLAILISFAYSFNNRSVPIAASLSLENDFLRKRKFFIFDALYGISASFNTIAALSHLEIVFQVLIGSSGDIVSTLCSTLGLNQSVTNNTVSFQKCMKALKHVVMDCLIQSTITGEVSHSEIERVSKFLQIHTGRKFTNYGKTDSYLHYKPTLDKLKSSDNYTNSL